jgi:hypothetical protein
MAEIKNLIPWDDLPVEMTHGEEDEEDEDTVVVEEKSENLFLPLSSSVKLQESGEYYEDVDVPSEFIEMLDRSPFPFLTSIEIIESNSPHKGTAEVDITSATATWAIIARQLQIFEEANGGNPPKPELTPEEKLTRNIGGII